MSDIVKELSQDTFDQTIQAENIALTDFWAPWCGPCRMIAPHVEAAAKKLDGEAAFFKVNIDENIELAERYDVQTIPTLVIFKGGEEVARLVGVRGRDDIEAAVRAAMG